MRFEWTNTLRHENALFSGLRDEGFNWHTLQPFIAGYQSPTKPVPARNGTYAPSPRRLATKSSGSGRETPPGQSRRVLALAQARKVDVILVTELTRRGRSARIAARSLMCFKFRFVSSPLMTCFRIEIGQKTS